MLLKRRDAIRAYVNGLDMESLDKVIIGIHDSIGVIVDAEDVAEYLAISGGGITGYDGLDSLIDVWDDDDFIDTYTFPFRDDVLHYVG